MFVRRAARGSDLAAAVRANDWASGAALAGVSPPVESSDSTIPHHRLTWIIHDTGTLGGQNDGQFTKLILDEYLARVPTGNTLPRARVGSKTQGSGLQILFWLSRMTIGVDCNGDVQYTTSGVDQRAKNEIWRPDPGFNPRQNDSCDFGQLQHPLHHSLRPTGVTKRRAAMRR